MDSAAETQIAGKLGCKARVPRPIKQGWTGSPPREQNPQHC